MRLGHGPRSGFGRHARVLLIDTLAAAGGSTASIDPAPVSGSAIYVCGYTYRSSPAARSLLRLYSPWLSSPQRPRGALRTSALLIAAALTTAAPRGATYCGYTYLGCTYYRALVACYSPGSTHCGSTIYWPMSRLCGGSGGDTTEQAHRLARSYEPIQVRLLLACAMHA